MQKKNCFPSSTGIFSIRGVILSVQLNYLITGLNMQRKTDKEMNKNTGKTKKTPQQWRPLLTITTTRTSN